jgi:hypothetical protein
MSDDVNIKISATDNATATLRAVQAQLGSFSASIKGLAGFTLAGLGVRELASFATDSLKAYAESERAVTMLDRVLKSTGNTIKMTRQQIQEYADARMQQTAFDDDAIVEAASQLARFRDLSGDTFTATLDAAQDLATVMGTDLVSATQMLGRALSDPAEGLSKLARAGVLFTDSQKEQIKSLDAIGNKAGQQRIILEELQRQFGGAAVADAGTASGAIAQLSNAIGELKETIGELIAEDVINAIRFLTGKDPVNTKREAAQAAIRGSISLPNIPGTASERLPGLQGDIEKRSNAIDALSQFLQNQRNDDPNGVALLQPYLEALRDQQQKTQSLLDTARRLSGAESAARSAVAGALSIQAAAAAGEDAGSALGLQVRGMFFGPNWWQQQQQQQERSLSATESRFLTRGRGQLSPEAKKQAEDNAKQLAELKAIKDVLKNLGENMLIVEGIA